MSVFNLLSTNVALPWILLAVIGGMLACAATVFFLLWKRESSMSIGISALLSMVSSVPVAQSEEEGDALEEGEEESLADETGENEDPPSEAKTEEPVAVEELGRISHEKYAEELEQAKKKLKKLTAQVKQMKELREKLKRTQAEKKEAEGKRTMLEGEMERLQSNFSEYKEKKETELKNCKAEAEKEKFAALADFETKYEELKENYARSKEDLEALSEKTDKYYNLLLQADSQETELLQTLGSIRDLLIKTIGSESAEYLNGEIARVLTAIEEILKKF